MDEEEDEKGEMDEKEEDWREGAQYWLATSTCSAGWGLEQEEEQEEEEEEEGELEYRLLLNLSLQDTFFAYLLNSLKHKVKDVFTIMSHWDGQMD